MPDAYSETANRFALVASRYCDLVERSAGAVKLEFLSQAYQLLGELLIEAARIPAPPEIQHDENKDLASAPDTTKNVDRVGCDDWSRVYESLKTTLGNWNLYWEVFDPRTGDKAIQASLADDLAGVYRDLKNGLALYAAGPESVSEALFTWREDFWSHWGQHATDSLRVIHRYLGERS